MDSATHTALLDTFADYKAEWLGERIYSLFEAPSYFHSLTRDVPCMLLGDRGAGKTTVLLCLAYQGQYRLRTDVDPTRGQLPFYGFYYRFNTNRVTAFKGPERTGDEWTRAFAHYLSLELCEVVGRFLSWHASQYSDSPSLPADVFRRTGRSLNVGEPDDVCGLLAAIDQARGALQASLHDSRTPLPPLSIQGTPVDALIDALKEQEFFRGARFLFLFDEFENLEPGQQRVVNTLIKHCSPRYSLKVAVRDYAWKDRRTLRDSEQLVDPADFVRIDIRSELEGKFASFARSVCNARLGVLANSLPSEALDIAAWFPGLDEEAEALKLGLPTVLEKELRGATLEPSMESEIRSLPLLEAFVILRSGHDASGGVAGLLALRRSDPDKWTSHFDNYRHAYLFAIRRGKRGIRKYYCGWDTITRLAAGNTRYVLEIVREAMSLDEALPRRGRSRVAPEAQTLAAQRIARKNLRELEGLSGVGGDLARVVLGLGRVLQVMARQPEGHAPEVTQFRLGDPNVDEASLEGLSATQDKGVMLLYEGLYNLALVRWPASKLQGEDEVPTYDYSLHPLFAALFSYSHRRKRKMVMYLRDLIGFTRAPRPTIESMLRQSNRNPDEALPEQLELFRGFYE